MKWKMTVLTIILTASVIGTLVFQIDWVHKTYLYEHGRIRNQVQKALAGALNKFHAEYNDEVAKLIQPKIIAFNRYAGEIFVGNDSLIIHLNRDSLPLAGIPEVQDGQATYIGRVKVILPTKKLKYSALGTAAENKRALDTLKKLFPVPANLCSPLYFKADSAKIMRYFYANLAKANIADVTRFIQPLFMCSSGEWVPPKYEGFIAYRASGTIAYTSGKRWMSVNFHTNPVKIISGMLVQVLSSVVLLVITTITYISMMRTILRQKRLADMKDDFIDNMTHELKTPIATISAAIEGMQSFNALADKEKTARYLEVSRNELSRLNDMVTKVLNISAYEQKNLSLHIKEVDVLHVLQDIVKAEKLRAVKQVDFSVSVPDAMKNIQADPDHLRNVLVNLIDNAIKYSGETVQIAIRCYQENNFTFLRMTDNGIGIPAADIPYIFDKFYRVHTGNVHNVKGTGLGLSYVKYVVEAHGGYITVKSNVNQGSEFTIALPL
ncbi:HAMP domain-containing sensor histidine kinase [Mucilaginibacter sp. PAMB04168]|uniref:sensor histidine kinase n=1 Tax=Mucilaginibacter sp. PAMB04168 TaxID=3138567 RepID=UPI0031F61FA1